MRLWLVWLVWVGSAVVPRGSALDNGLARTPPMGWMSWAKFFCQIDCIRHPLMCISEQLYMDMADIMVEEGYLAAGYEYVHIDDCWMSLNRTASGKLTANETRFPHGIPALADHMHHRGMKLAIYEDFGNKTCGGYPGSRFHLKDDADTFASWKVDYLKLDGCYVNISFMDIGYPKMEEYLNKTGRPIVYSCSWPDYQRATGKQPNYTFIAEHCNLWRNYDDIGLSWQSVQGIIHYYDRHQDELAAVHGPGHWNDPDMIIVGNAELTEAQSEAQMAIWSVWSAPLIMSNDLRFMPPAFKRILLNRKVIAVDQDPLGNMGKLVANTTYVGVYLKPMTPVDRHGHHSFAIAVLNRNLESSADVSFVISRIGLGNPQGYFVENLFTNEQLGLMKPDDILSALVKPTGVAFFKASIAQSHPTKTSKIDTANTVL